MYPTFPTYKASQEYSAFGNKKGMMRYFYRKSKFYNWNILYLKNALKFVNDKLANEEEQWIYKTHLTGELTPLKQDTLYIPDYVMIKFNKFTGDESEKHDEEKLLKKYPYPYKIVTLEQLNEKISNSSGPIFYLSYIRSNAQIYVNVINSQTSEFIYSQYSSTTYNIAKKHFSQLARSIKL